MEPTTLDKPGTRRRRLEPAPEAYPDIDFGRVSEAAERYRSAQNDSEAVSVMFIEPVQIVSQPE